MAHPVHPIPCPSSTASVCSPPLPRTKIATIPPPLDTFHLPVKEKSPSSPHFNMLRFPLFRLALLLLFPVSNSLLAVLDISVVTQPDITLSSPASNIAITVNGEVTTTIDTVASTPITCLGSDTGIDAEYILDYISYFCSSVSASQPDILIKVTSDEGNVDIIYAWEAAGDNYDQSCSTVCADAFKFQQYRD
jgi:hypothetical protein